VRRQPVLEKGIVARILAALKKYPHVVVRKRHGTAFGVAGDPDLYGTIKGRHFEIEVKRPNDPTSRLTELQAKRLLEWKLAGTITGVARSVEDALVILGLARPGKPESYWRCCGCREYTWRGHDAPARCPRCGQEKPAALFLDWQGEGRVCLECHLTLEGAAVAMLAERIRLRRAGQCIAIVTPGRLCGAPASIVDDTRGGLVCREHAPKL
jgi:hypothetical protein